MGPGGLAWLACLASPRTGLVRPACTTQQRHWAPTATSVALPTPVAAHVADTQHCTSQANLLTERGNALMNDTRTNIIELSTDVSATNQALKSLQTDTQSIQKALLIIEEFSSQTNLLALNASA